MLKYKYFKYPRWYVTIGCIHILKIQIPYFMEAGVSSSPSKLTLENKRRLRQHNSNKTVLTFSPHCICGDQFVNECHIFKSLPLTFTDDFWIATFVCPKQVQVEHHLSTLSQNMTPPTRVPDLLAEVTKLDSSSFVCGW